MNSGQNPFDDIANRLAGAIPPGLEHLRRDLQRNFRAILHSEFQRLGLVSREEFEVQSAVLRNTREQLEALEARVTLLEQQASAAPARGKSSKKKA